MATGDVRELIALARADLKNTPPRDPRAKRAAARWIVMLAHCALLKDRIDYLTACDPEAFDIREYMATTRALNVAANFFTSLLRSGGDMEHVVAFLRDLVAADKLRKSGGSDV